MHRLSSGETREERGDDVKQQPHLILPRGNFSGLTSPRGIAFTLNSIQHICPTPPFKFNIINLGFDL